MIEVKTPRKPVANWQQVRDEWVNAVTQLVNEVDLWCKARDWPTRRIEKRIDDPQIGEYTVPALLIQVDLVKLLLEPVARFVPGAAGLVDLYVMPRYADEASLLLRDDGWWIGYDVTGDEIPDDVRRAEPDATVAPVFTPLTAEEFGKVIRRLV